MQKLSEDPALIVPPGTIIYKSNNNIIINPEPEPININSGNFISPMSMNYEAQMHNSNKMSRQVSNGSLYTKLEQGKAQTTQKSMPNLKKNQLKITQNQSEAREETEETDQQLRFYKEELRKRDDIVMFLCKKMKGMESKINLLTKQYQQTNDQEISYVLRQETDLDFEKMLSPQPRNQVLSSE